MLSGPILLNYSLMVELPRARPKFKLNSGILFTSFQKMPLWQKAQEPIKKVISQYLYCVPSHPKGRRLLQFPLHYAVLATWLVFNWHRRVCGDFFPTLGLLGFCEKLQLHFRVLVFAWVVMKSRGWFTLLGKSGLNSTNQVKFKLRRRRSDTGETSSHWAICNCGPEKQSQRVSSDALVKTKCWTFVGITWKIDIFPSIP